MYEPKDIMDLMENLLGKINETYDQFLDNRSIEWANRVKAEFNREPSYTEENDKEAKERLKIYTEIASINERYARRDMVIPKHELEDQLARFKQLEQMREATNYPENPSIIVEFANLSMLAGNYQDAKKQLIKAIEILENPHPSMANKVMDTRDNVLAHFDLTRCKYMEGDVYGAIETGDKALKLAPNLLPNEESEFKKYGGMNRKFYPIAIYGYLSACDSRIQNKEAWQDLSSPITKEFTGLWTDSAIKFNTPKSWPPFIKLAIISDEIWATRARSYISEMAKDLYIELGENKAVCFYRFIKSNLGGFEIDFKNFGSQKRKAECAIAILLLCLLLSDHPINKEQKFGSIVEKNIIVEIAGDNFSPEKNFEPEKFITTIKNNLGENANITIDNYFESNSPFGDSTHSTPKMWSSGSQRGTRQI